MNLCGLLTLHVRCRDCGSTDAAVEAREYKDGKRRFSILICARCASPNVFPYAPAGLTFRCILCHKWKTHGELVRIFSIDERSALCETCLDALIFGG